MNEIKCTCQSLKTGSELQQDPAASSHSTLVPSRSGSIYRQLSQSQPKRGETVTKADLYPDLDKEIARLRKEASDFHGERITVRRKANRPWNSDGT